MMLKQDQFTVTIRPANDASSLIGVHMCTNLNPSKIGLHTVMKGHVLQQDIAIRTGHMEITRAGGSCALLALPSPAGPM